MTYRVVDYWLLFSFLVLDVMKSAVLSWSHGNKEVDKRPPDFNVIFTKDVLSLFLAVVYCLFAWGKSFPSIIIQSRSLFYQYIPVCLLFVISQNAAFTALQLLDIGTFKLMIQGCTPLTVIFSVLILKQRFVKKQVYAIIANVSFSVAFYLAKNNGVSSSRILGEGIFYSIIVTIVSSLAGVTSEKTLKSNPQTLPVQFLFSRLASVAISTCIYNFMRITSEKQSLPFFKYFDNRTYLVIFQFAVSGFLVAAITKRLSSTAKAVTQAASAAVAQMITMFASLEWMNVAAQSIAKSNTNPLVGMCALGIIGTVVYFHSISASKLDNRMNVGADVEIGRIAESNSE
jgi:drug/metabolite transporter (DMT)-like permease